jgi:hypothetical protein
MLQSEQAWAGPLYNGMEFNPREEVEDFVSAMEQMEPDQLLHIEPYQIFLIEAIGAEPDEYDRGESGGLLSPLIRSRAVQGSPQPLMRFCPTCDQWRSVFGEQTVCSLCNTPCEVTQDAMSKLPEGCNSGLMGM